MFGVLSKRKFGKIAPDCPNKAVRDNEENTVNSAELCDWASLPPQLLEAIFHKVKDGAEAGNAKDMFSAIGVCKTWRAAGHGIFFKNNWQCGSVIQHPAQLITLCPLTQARGGHIKCYVMRELASSGLSGKAYRFILCQGADYTKTGSKFLLAAQQEGKQASYAIYLNRTCSGKPIARLSANMMRTSYLLTTVVPGSSGSSSGSSGGAVEASGAGGGSSGRAGGRTFKWGSLGTSSSKSHKPNSSSFNVPPASSFGSSSMELTTRQKQLHRLQQQQMLRQSSSPEQLQLHLLQAQDGRCCSCAACVAAAAAAGGLWGPQELLRVSYKLRVRGMMLPRRMSVALPAPQSQQQQQQTCMQPRYKALEQATADLPGAPAAAAAGLQFDYAHPAAANFSEIECDILHADADQNAAAAAGRTAGSRRTSDSGLPLLHSLSVQQQLLLEQQQPDSPSVSKTFQLLQLQQCQQQQLGWPRLLHYLHNKSPHWNDGLRCWCLNFRGRVKLASVKNFQLITDPNPPIAAVADADVMHGGPLWRPLSHSNSSELSRSSGASSRSTSSSNASMSTAVAAFGPPSEAGPPTAAAAAAAGDAAGAGAAGLGFPEELLLHAPQQQQQQQRRRQQGLLLAAANPALLKGSPHTASIVTQFGKVDSNVFILDYDPVLISGLQAFAVALTTFGTKVLL